MFSVFSSVTAICVGKKGETPAGYKPAFIAIMASALVTRDVGSALAKVEGIFHNSKGCWFGSRHSLAFLTDTQSCYL
jgi:hypothetical protein